MGLPLNGLSSDTQSWSRSDRYCTDTDVVSSQLCCALLYNIHFNVTLKGGRMTGQPSKVTAIAVKPSPHFLENLCGHGANPYNQTLTKRGSRKSIKPSLHSSQLPFPLASATCAFQAPLHNEQSISPSPGHSPQHCH